MARHLRIEYPGAVYHVMSRGNHGDRIYRGDQDRERFLDTLAEACEQTGWQIHAYVLMNNHYHALIETPEPNLVVGTKWWMRKRTVVSRRWISQRLGMGDESRVTQGVGRVKRSTDRGILRLKSQLEAVGS